MLAPDDSRSARNDELTGYRVSHGNGGTASVVTCESGKTCKVAYEKNASRNAVDAPAAGMRAFRTYRK